MKNTTSSHNPETLSRLFLFAVFIGGAVPSLVLGRAVFGVIAGLAILALMASALRPVIWRGLVCGAKSPIGIAILANMLLWSASALGSNYAGRSIEAVLRTGLFVCLGVIVFHGLTSARELQTLAMKAFVATALVGAIIATLGSTVFPELYGLLRFQGWVLAPVTAAYKAYAALSVLVVPLLLWIAINWRGRWQVFAFLAAGLFLFIVWETSNRAALAGFLGILLAGLIAEFARNAKRFIVVVLGLGATAAFAGVGVWLKMTRGRYTEVAPQNEWLFPVWLVDFQRQTIWSHTLKVFESAPWFGIGANTINFAPGADKPLPGNEVLHMIPAHPHNWVVEVMAETGALGLVALLFTLVFFYGYLLLKYRKTGAAGYLIAISVFAGYWTSGLFNFSYWSAWWQLSFVLMTAFALAVFSATPSKN